MTIVSDTNAVQAARATLAQVSDPATRPDISGMSMPEARDALRQWEQRKYDAEMALQRAQAALQTSRIVHAQQVKQGARR